MQRLKRLAGVDTDTITDEIFSNMKRTDEYFKYHEEEKQTHESPGEPDYCEIYYTGEVDLKALNVDPSVLSNIENNEYFRSQAASELAAMAKEHGHEVDVDPNRDVELHVNINGDKLVVNTTYNY